MIAWWRPWQSLLPVWLPAVALCVASMVVYGWLNSESLGREAQLRTKVSDLEESLERLQQIQEQAAEERLHVTELNQEMNRLYDTVFGSLDDRLTSILRAVGSATREAGLLPGRFSYSWQEEEALELVRFGVKFSFSGEYSQVRTLLAAIQESPEFLVVDRISFSGEGGTTTSELKISVEVATYLAYADRARLDQLTGGARTARTDAAEAPPAGGP